MGTASHLQRLQFLTCDFSKEIHSNSRLQKSLYDKNHVSVYLTIEKDDIRFKINLRNLAFVLIGSIIITDSSIILSNPHSREPMVIIVLDVTGAIALSLGILVICRLKFHGAHGKSFFVLHWVYYCGSLPT